MREGNQSGSDPYDGLTLRIERHYLRLLRLRTAPEIETALAEVLRLLVEVMGCELAYVEVFGSSEDERYWLAHACDAEAAAAVRARVSRDLVRMAIMKRKTVETTFPAGHLQRPERTGALCTPLGGGVPVGVLYVESSTWITADDRERLETIAHHLGSIHPTITNRVQPPLRAQLRALQERLIREALERNRGNIAAVARELAVGRTLIYRTLKRRGKPQ
jgi:DNA-binding phage protein